MEYIKIGLMSVNYSTTHFLTTNARMNHVPEHVVTTVLGILIVLSILGNSLVCCAFVVQPRLRRVVYYPVLNLAIADILCGLVAMTSYLAKKHVFGGVKERVVCDISRFSYFVTEYASVLSLTVISVDRALAILRPLTYTTTVTAKRMKIVLGVVWCYTILVSSLPFFWRKTKSENTCSFRPTKMWSLCVILMNVLFPFLLILICQGSIYSVAIRHSKVIKHQRQVALRSLHGDTRRQMNTKADAWVVERKATITLSAVIGLFLICWGPSTVYYTMHTVSPKRFAGAFGKNESIFNAVVKLLTFSNSCFNPVIYAGLNRDFREAFLRVLSRRLYKSAVERSARTHGNQRMRRDNEYELSTRG